MAKGKGEEKPYEALAFTDDFMFGKILTEHPEICRALAELITGRKVHRIRLLNKQLTIKMLRSGKGVRFDVFFEEDKNTAYDFDMEAHLKKCLPKRTRYYQSMMDSRLLRMGHDYSKLPDSYIIFICLEDPFEENRYQYSFKNLCTEDGGMLALGDGTTKIFLNANGRQGASGVYAEEKIVKFLGYVKDGVPRDELTEKIDAALADARDDEEGRIMYMTLLERDREMKAEGRREGRVEGRREGRVEGRKEGGKNMVYIMVQDRDVPPKRGAERLGISEQQLKKNMIKAGYKWPETD